MSSPILRLYQEIWTSILDLLDTKAVLNLFETGNRQLISNMRHSVHRAIWQKDGSPFLDLDPFFKTCKRLSSAEEAIFSLKTMVIAPRERSIVVKRPSEALYLPSTLTSLTMHFDAVFSLVQHVKLSEMLPNLLHLSLKGNQAAPFDCLDLDLPPRLESLTIAPPTPIALISREWVASLPRTLASLSVCAIWGQPANGLAEPPIEHLPVSWPPSLSHLRFAVTGRFAIEHFPRTLTSLRMHTYLCLETSFQVAPDGRKTFPWRRFFPHLSSIKLPRLTSQNSLFDLDLLIRTLVLDDVLGDANVETFIASGFWDLPSLRHFQTPEGRAEHPYPLFKSLELDPHTVAGLLPVVFENDIQTLSPLLDSADFGSLRSRSSLELPSLLKATSELELDMNPEGVNQISLSPSVKSLSVWRTHVSNISPYLTSLRTNTFVGTGVNGVLLPNEINWPSNLTILDLQWDPKPLHLISALPVTITDLAIPLCEVEGWTLIAERLVNLRKLDLLLCAGWASADPLTPISSPYLDSFAVRFINGCEPLEGRAIGLEFFEPSPFPPTLRTLSVKHQHTFRVFNASIIAVVPRQLTALAIHMTVWDSEPREEDDGPMESYSATTNPEELMKALPPNLTQLNLRGVRRRSAGASPEILRHLPRSITKLEVFNMLDMSNATDTSLADILPPYTYQGSVESHTFSPSVLRPTGFLN